MLCPNTTLERKGGFGLQFSGHIASRKGNQVRDPSSLSWHIEVKSREKPMTHAVSAFLLTFFTLHSSGPSQKNEVPTLLHTPTSPQLNLLSIILQMILGCGMLTLQTNHFTSQDVTVFYWLDTLWNAPFFFYLLRSKSPRIQTSVFLVSSTVTTLRMCEYISPPVNSAECQPYPSHDSNSFILVHRATKDA